MAARLVNLSLADVPIVAIFKPHEDETLAFNSHEAILVVRTNEGDWLFCEESK
jgi:hypothetical protein